MNPKDLIGAKKAPLRYVPPALAIEASGPMEDGAIKYGPFNWRDQPVEVVGYVEAVFRHLYAFLDGQDTAEDSGHTHIGHAIAGLGIIADAKANGTLIDNRYTKGPAADMLRERDKSDIFVSAAVNEADAHDSGKCNCGIPNCKGTCYVHRTGRGLATFSDHPKATSELPSPRAEWPPRGFPKFVGTFVGAPPSGEWGRVSTFPPVTEQVLPEVPVVNVDNRGEWPPDTRVSGRLTCCGATEHTLDCPQYR